MPYLGSTLFVVSIVLLLLSSLLGAVLLAAAMFGPFVERAARVCEARPRTSLIVGLPIGVVLFFVAAALFQGGGGARALGALVSAGSLGLAVLALAAVALRVGTTLWSRYDVDRPYRRVLRGAIIVELAAAAPLFGWFVVLPLSLAMGIGAIVVSRFSRTADARSSAWDPSHITSP